MTRRFDADGSRRAPDELIVEEPMSIRLDGELIATTMRTRCRSWQTSLMKPSTKGAIY